MSALALGRDALLAEQRYSFTASDAGVVALSPGAPGHCADFVLETARDSHMSTELPNVRFVLHFPIRHNENEAVWRTLDRFSVVDVGPNLPTLVAFYSQAYPIAVIVHRVIAEGIIRMEDDPHWQFQGSITDDDCVQITQRLLHDDLSHVLRYYRECTVITASGARLGTFEELADRVSRTTDAPVSAERPGLRKSFVAVRDKASGDDS